MPPRNSQREGNHEIHETHENWRYSNNSYGNDLIIYSRRLAGQANGDRGGPPTLVAGLSRFFRVFRVFRGSIFLFFHAPPLRGPAPARPLAGTKAIRRAHFRLGHRAPGRGVRRARTVSGCVNSAFLNISQHFTGHLFRPWRPSSARDSDGGPDDPPRSCSTLHWPNPRRKRQPRSGRNAREAAKSS